MTILGEPHHGGPGGEILCHSVQRLMQGQLGRPTISHHFQYDGGCSDKAMVDGGGRGGSRNGNIWDSGTAASGVEIFRQRYHFLP